MADEEIGKITISDNAALVFSSGSWKGKSYAHVRKFIQTQRYDGPTKSGLSVDDEELADLLEALDRLRKEPPRADDYEFAKIQKYKDKDIVIRIIKPDDPMSLPRVDIREFVSSPRYTGPTKKGIRFLWDKLSEVIGLLQVQSQLIAQADEKQPQLFPKHEKKSDHQTEKIGESSSRHSDEILANIFPNGPRPFPEDFFINGNCRNQIQLPSETINITTQIDGECVVRSDFGFCCIVRNPIEGKYILYCWLQGHRVVHMPEEMIKIFKAVKEYENYLRESSRALIQEYERKCGSRPTAMYQAKEVFKKLRLPWLEHS